jgi:hypothetical protein
MNDWKHKDEWKKAGKEFLVAVSRHTGHDPDDHRWCVYLYVYPEHAMFSSFDADATEWDQPYFDVHGYCSLFNVHRRNDGTIGSFQLGWDYNHSGDSRYNDMATKERASSVFYDAQRLFDELTGERAE